MPELDAEHLIATLGLQPLPWEGGYYRETWRSEMTVPKAVLPDVYTGERSAGTAIYYLLTLDTVSRMHRLPSDETFHFYLGRAVDMLLLGGAADGVVRLGQDLGGGEMVQLTVPGNTWMGCRLADVGPNAPDFALMGTTVAPGFDFDDLEMGDFEGLSGQFPDFNEMLLKLT